jgi:hypothetical protein
MKVKIKQGNEMLDATIEMVEGVMVVSPKEMKFEPKDGDIVYVKASCDNIIIYKENVSDIGRYVNLSDYIYLYTGDNTVCSKDSVKEIRYATEEEKKLLFDKLKEEGYEFDFEKKELVKLKWKPKEGEDFWFPLYYTFPSEFKPITSLLNAGRDKEILDKGWCFNTKEECQEFCNRLNDAINSVKL